MSKHAFVTYASLIYPNLAKSNVAVQLTMCLKFLQIFFPEQNSFASNFQ